MPTGYWSPRSRRGDRRIIERPCHDQAKPLWSRRRWGVGHFAGQIARLAEALVNLRSPTFSGDLHAACGESGVHVFFDNVGGPILGRPRFRQALQEFRSTRSIELRLEGFVTADFVAGWNHARSLRDVVARRNFGHSRHPYFAAALELKSLCRSIFAAKNPDQRPPARMPDLQCRQPRYGVHHRPYTAQRALYRASGRLRRARTQRPVTTIHRRRTTGVRRLVRRRRAEPGRQRQLHRDLHPAPHIARLTASRCGSTCGALPV